MRTNCKQKQGFIALMSVIIISTILLGLVTTASTASYFSRFSVLDGEYKENASALALGCVQVAMLRLSQNYNYVPTNESVNIGIESCKIVSATRVGITATHAVVEVKTKATYKGVFTTLVTTVQVQNPAVASASITPDIVLKSRKEVR